MRVILMAGVIVTALLPGAASAKKKVAPAPAPAAVVSSVPALAPANTLYLDLSTGGRVVIQLRPDKAPLSVERIKTLAKQGFYDGLTFHRVIEGFMAQTGDPKGTGEGGSTLPDLKAEFNDMPHVRGEMAMARAQSPDSANSQFFIMLSPNLQLDGKYSPIGRVVEGMQYVDTIEKGEPPANPSKIVHATLGDGGASVGTTASAVVAAPSAPVPTSAAAPGSSARDVARAVEAAKKTVPESERQQ